VEQSSRVFPRMCWSQTSQPLANDISPRTPSGVAHNLCAQPHLERDKVIIGYRHAAQPKVQLCPTQIVRLRFHAIFHDV